MTSRSLERLAAGGGIIGALLVIIYVFMPPHDPSYPYTSQAIATLAGDREAYLFKNLLGTLSFFFFLFFLGSLYSTLRRAEGGSGWLSILALGGGFVFTAVHSIESVVSYALGWHVALAGNIAVVTALEDIENLVAYYYAVPLAVMLVATSIVAYQTRVLPRWIAWVGFVAGAAWLVGAVGVLDPQNGPLTLIGFGGGLLLFFLWTFATSIALVRLPDASAEGSAVVTVGAAPAGVR